MKLNQTHIDLLSIHQGLIIYDTPFLSLMYHSAIVLIQFASGAQQNEAICNEPKD